MELKILRVANLCKQFIRFIYDQKYAGKILLSECLEIHGMIYEKNSNGNDVVCWRIGIQN